MPIMIHALTMCDDPCIMQGTPLLRSVKTGNLAAWRAVNNDPCGFAQNVEGWQWPWPLVCYGGWVAR